MPYLHMLIILTFRFTVVLRTYWIGFSMMTTARLISCVLKYISQMQISMMTPDNLLVMAKMMMTLLMLEIITIIVLGMGIKTSIIIKEELLIIATMQTLIIYLCYEVVMIDKLETIKM